ncbi:DUF1153 domain-containing protein [Amylibacter sp. SFDW26]|uniref:CtrA inhibitor SciP n=1 Tax=Amylibacter sp. SFDW26 TaxID=2652722 RepID=UPI001261FC40|nr:DUF1153 domain-containing protein [Amylibacter sp. SFDW26]KAB7615897.1 DUF1153 domain-containing protein [Amylibacter sp. SFDW26]
MYLKKNDGPAYVTLPNGQKFTRSDLPERTTKRWVASRKATVILGVETGLITMSEACELYGLSQDEFDEWHRAIKQYGFGALKATKLKSYRQP